jgi:23S rRNA pseudouridine2605 synthase
MTQNRVPLNRALSKLGLLSRAAATTAIRDGRVRVDGRLVRNPAVLVVPERVRVEIDGRAQSRAAWRTILLHKPRGVVTTRRDPEGRRTIYDVVGEEGAGLIAVGRLDLASTGLLLMTTDTQLAHRITDPANEVPRVYIVTVRGRVEDGDVEQLTNGVRIRRELYRASAAAIRKASGRESHVTVELKEGRNREIRRLFEAIGHEVTRLKRVRLGRLELGALQPGEWRDLSRSEVEQVFAI